MIWSVLLHRTTSCTSHQVMCSKGRWFKSPDRPGRRVNYVASANLNLVCNILFWTLMDVIWMLLVKCCNEWCVVLNHYGLGLYVESWLKSFVISGLPGLWELKYRNLITSVIVFVLTFLWFGRFCYSISGASDHLLTARAISRWPLRSSGSSSNGDTWTVVGD